MTAYIPYKDTICGRSSSQVESYIRKHQEKMTRKEISEELDIPYNILLLFITTHGLANETHQSWTDEETDFLCENFAKMSRRDLAQKLGRSVASVNGKAQDLFLSGRNKPWTQKEIDLAVDMYKSGATVKEIAEKLGRKEKTVASKIWKSTEYRKYKKSGKKQTEKA